MGAYHRQRHQSTVFVGDRKDIPYQQNNPAICYADKKNNIAIYSLTKCHERYCVCCTAWVRKFLKFYVYVVYP